MLSATIDPQAIRPPARPGYTAMQLLADFSGEQYSASRLLSRAGKPGAFLRCGMPHVHPL